jgi:hypothetical protein
MPGAAISRDHAEYRHWLGPGRKHLAKSCLMGAPRAALVTNVIASAFQQGMVGWGYWLPRNTEQVPSSGAGWRTVGWTAGFGLRTHHFSPSLRKSP